MQQLFSCSDVDDERAVLEHSVVGNLALTASAGLSSRLRAGSLSISEIFFLFSILFLILFLKKTSLIFLIAHI